MNSDKGLSSVLLELRSTSQLTIQHQFIVHLAPAAPWSVVAIVTNWAETLYAKAMIASSVIIRIMQWLQQYYIMAFLHTDDTYESTIYISQHQNWPKDGMCATQMDKQQS